MSVAIASNLQAPLGPSYMFCFHSFSLPFYPHDLQTGHLQLGSKTGYGSQQGSDPGTRGGARDAPFDLPVSAPRTVLFWCLQSS